MWQTLFALAPLGATALGLGTWTVIVAARALRRRPATATGRG